MLKKDWIELGKEKPKAGKGSRSGPRSSRSRHRRPRPLSVPGNAMAREIRLRESRLAARGISYGTYIRSDHWRDLVARLRRDGCQMCGRGGPVALHHTTYRHLFAETVVDVVTFCSSCHELVHILASSTTTFSLDPRQWPASPVDPRAALERVYELDERRRQST